MYNKLISLYLLVLLKKIFFIYPMVTVRLKELETGEEERNYSLILILSPSGHTPLFYKKKQNKIFNHPYTDWLPWSEGKFVFFLALFVPNLLKTNLLWSHRFVWNKVQSMVFTVMRIYISVSLSSHTCF